MNGYDNLVSALEATFDFHSARVIAHEAVKGAGLGERTDWNDDELRLVAAQLPANKDLTPVLAKLGIAVEEAAPATA